MVAFLRPTVFFILFPIPTPVAEKIPSDFHLVKPCVNSTYDYNDAGQSHTFSHRKKHCLHWRTSGVTVVKYYNNTCRRVRDMAVFSVGYEFAGIKLKRR